MYKKIVLFVCILAIVACKTGGDSATTTNEKMTKSGYAYIVHADTDNPAPRIGEQIIFDLDIIDDTGAVISTMRNAPTRPNAMITAPKPGEQANPVMDVLRIMGEGDSLSVIVPKDSLRGPAPGFENSAFVKYRIAAKQIMTAEDFKAMVDEDTKKKEAEMEVVKGQEKEKLQEYGLFLNDFKAGKYDGKMKEIGDGLKMYLIEEGTGENIKSGQLAEIHYFGYLMGGRCFDNSYKYGRPYGVNVGRNAVIPGWERALLEMKEGTKALVVIPPALAYGEKGSGPIPANSTLAFYMDVTDVYY